jgi:putative flippase GtrA
VKALDSLRRMPLVGSMFRHRFVKFGTVGAIGTVVNVAVLYAGQEFLFRGIEPPSTRLNVSLALAIAIATVNNFVLNRAWTWLDRREHVDTPVLVQFGQYAVACWLGIVLQVALTHLFSNYVHYIVANVAAIVVASVANFIVNDHWTFGRLRMLLRRWRHAGDAAGRPREP